MTWRGLGLLLLGLLFSGLLVWLILLLPKILSG